MAKRFTPALSDAPSGRPAKVPLTPPVLRAMVKNVPLGSAAPARSSA